MSNEDELKREVEALRERASRLCAAVRRINANPELDSVLDAVLENAREMTGASYGVIVTVDAAGRPEDVVFSGLSEETRREMADWHGGRRLFDHLRRLPGAVRLDDVRAYARANSLPDELLPAAAVQGTSMHHGSEHVGSIFLVANGHGTAFTDADEEVLELFASQAAAAVANAHMHRDERRARANLEALIDTSPVGVVVFDAPSGQPVSLNREATRIVGSLSSPGGAEEELLRLATCRLPDGREIALDEFSLAQAFGDAATLRAEEIELYVPDGRSVTTLANVTPIRTEHGAVESVVVTLQDLEPLRELDRLRADFLGMVSHELRTPLLAIKGSTGTLLGSNRVLDPAELREFHRIIDEQADQMSNLLTDLLDAGRIDTGTLSVAPEPLEVGALLERARTTFAGGGARHNVLVDLPSDLPRAMADPQRIVQVLNNLLANAARHSAETAPIRITAERVGVHIAISVSDEGQGVPAEQLPRLFQKYPIDGRIRLRASGLGLAICKGLVEAHGGRIRAESDGAGMGTRITFTIPAAGEAGEVSGGAPGPRREAGEQASILVVDDDPNTLRFVRDALAAAGYVTLVTGDHRELADMVRTERPALVLLDLMLPGADGIELMESVPELSEQPVIFVSGYGRDETIARALEAGAVDYVVKPFSPTELTARIAAALRRQEKPEPFLLKDLAIDFDRRQVLLAGRSLELTPTEFELLRALALNAGRVMTHDALLRQVWSRRADSDPKIVRAFVKKLRHKLGDDAARPTYIFGVRGVGYRMAQPGTATAS